MAAGAEIVPVATNKRATAIGERPQRFADAAVTLARELRD
jgi:hypothetical protein